MCSFARNQKERYMRGMMRNYVKHILPPPQSTTKTVWAFVWAAQHVADGLLEYKI